MQRSVSAGREDFYHSDLKFTAKETQEGADPDANCDNPAKHHQGTQTFRNIK